MQDKVLGILGGMGPLASTAFLKSIYERNLQDTFEQNYPNVLLHSVSAVPDRTTALMTHSEDAFFQRFLYHLKILNKTSVSRIVVCCITSHYFLSRVPPEISDKIISLIRITAHELLKKKTPALLLASMGAYQKRVFPDPLVTRTAGDYIILPSDEDKELIHNMIYQRLKKGVDNASVYLDVKRLLKKYETDTFIAGCTEFHLLVTYLIARKIQDVQFIDPLITIVDNLETIMSDTYF